MLFIRALYRYVHQVYCTLSDTARDTHRQIGVQDIYQSTPFSGKNPVFFHIRF